MEGTETVNSTETSTSAAPEQAAPASESSASVTNTPGTEAAQAAPAYTPNYNFKVMDKEHQFDEWVRGAIKSKEHEDKLRDLYTRSHGLDAVKEKFEGYKSEVIPMLQDYKELVDLEQQIVSGIKNNDMRAVVSAIGLSEDHILKYAKEILDEREMPAEQRAQIERQRQLAEQNANYQSKEQYFAQQQEQLAVQNRTLELKMELFKPEVSSFQQKFDSLVGTPGAFESAVVRYGQFYALQHKQDLTPNQVIGLVMNDYGKFVNAASATPEQPVSQPTVNEKKPVLPNMGSGGSKSPTKKQPQSLQDLRNLRKNLSI